jgi:outer membrane protein TolC
MSTAQPRHLVRIALIFSSILAYPIITGGIARAQPEPKPQVSLDKAAEIKTLLRERRDSLKRMVVLLVTQFQVGRGDSRSLFEAERDFLRATLDLDESTEARIAALRDHLKLAEDFAKYAEARLKTGTVSQVDVLWANVGLLEARIELLREELKAKPGKQ